MKKELERAIRPFRRRLAAEAALRAACVSGVFVLPVSLLLALARRCFGGTGGGMEALLTAVWALLFAALYVLRYRPVPERTAARLDALCGMDRVATATAFSDDEGVLCRLQREDTVRRMAAIVPKALRIELPVPALVACLTMAALLAAVPLIPQTAADRIRACAAEKIPGLVRQESEETAALRGMMEALRAEVAQSDIQAMERDALLARLDAWLARLDDGYADIAAVQEIQDALDGLRQTVRELTLRDTYMAAMIEFESLRTLGEAIYDQNMDVVVMILESMGRQLHEKAGMEQVNALMSLVYDVNASLARPLRDNSQEQLRQAMMMFAGGLEGAAEMVYNGRDNARMIDMALDTVEQYIRDYLGVPEPGERYDPFADMEAGQTAPRAEAAASGSAAEKPKSRAETEYVYDPPATLKASGYTPGALDAQGERQRIRAEEREHPADTAPYGEVYGAYYADYLRMLDDEAFPQALREAAQRYMNGL